MHSDSIKIDGYTVQIAQDIHAENPFETWDCEPPLLAYYDSGRHGFKSYNGAPDAWHEILRMLPASIFERKNRVAFLRRFILSDGDTLRAFAEESRRVGDIDAMAEILSATYESKPHGWSNAIEWLKTAAAILEYGGIYCHFTQSNGYSQGDSTLLLAVATPQWIELVGAPADSIPRQFESACELHGHWQWGDVYGVSDILDENGDAIDYGSCWGFYGFDHEKSGLLDHARNAISCHKEELAKQASHYTAALCSFA